MPEGPSIVILREQLEPFVGQRIEAAEGNSRLDKSHLPGQRIAAVHSWGKHLLIELESLTIRIHLLLFGSYRINERKESAPRLRLLLEGGELNFYGCSVQFIEGPLTEAYDWSMDVMSDAWSPRLTLKRLRDRPRLLACDALLDQSLFAGSGNIIKNEVLYRVRVHPLSTVDALPAAKLRELVREARAYAFDFLAWKRAGVLKAHWLAHGKRTCVRCKIPLVKVQELGRSRRRAFFCERCQKRYGVPDEATAESPQALDPE